jgi:beta-propeller repeat-containing protein
MKNTTLIFFAAAFIGLYAGLLPAQVLELSYSTYLGGTAHTSTLVYSIAVDSDNRAYVSGSTRSTIFPIENPYQSSLNGESEVFITKFSSSGSSLIYSTFLGGSEDDISYALSLGTDNRVYVAGYTKSSDFPTEAPYQATFNGGTDDAFVSLISSSGSELIYSTYLGGSEPDAVNIGGLYLDSDNRVYAVGYTISTDFPTVNPYQATHGGSYDGFICRFSSSGLSLTYSTYLGGELDESVTKFCLDQDNRMYVVGSTESSNFPTVAPYQSSSGGGIDTFVSRFSSTGSNLIYSTYLGGNLNDYGQGLSLGSDNQFYVSGQTASPDFPTEDPYQSSISGGTCDAFITRFASSGSSLIYSTYLGGDGGESADVIILDPENRLYVVGSTYSTNFPTKNPYHSFFAGGNYDPFVSYLSTSGSSLIYSTYLGGQGTDCGCDLDIDSENRVYLAGFTRSLDFPTVNPYQPENPGGLYGFVCKLAWITPILTPTPKPSPTPSVTTTPVQQTPTLVPPEPTPKKTPTPSATSTPSFTSTPSSTPTPTPTPTCGPTIDPQTGVIASGDYDGDGTDDIAIFRAGAGLWAVRGITRVYYGASSDLPVPGDYSGSDTAEISIYRGSSGLWAVRGLTRFYLGSGGIPVPGDYDGDGFCDAGVFTDSSGKWEIKDVTGVYFGRSLDWPIPGDFTGDGTTDIGIFRGTNGLWAVRGYTRAYYGQTPDWPIPGDYDGDGIDEIAIWRPCTGLWANRHKTRIYYGACIDWPRPADYDGTGTDDIGIFRETTSLWGMRGISRAYFGGVGDVPVTR